MCMNIYTHIMMMVMFNDEKVCRVCLYGVVAYTNVMCVSSFALLLRILVRKKSTSTHTHTHTQTNKQTKHT